MGDRRVLDALGLLLGESRGRIPKQSLNSYLLACHWPASIRRGSSDRITTQSVGSSSAHTIISL